MAKDFSIFATMAKFRQSGHTGGHNKNYSEVSKSLPDSSISTFLTQLNTFLMKC